MAESSGYIKLPQLKEEYVNWLMKTDQLEKAGQIKQESGNYLEAVELYLKGGLSATAARLAKVAIFIGLFFWGEGERIIMILYKNVFINVNKFTNLCF